MFFNVYLFEDSIGFNVFVILLAKIERLDILEVITV